VGAQELTAKIVADARGRAERLLAEGRAAADAVRERARSEQATTSEQARLATERETAPVVERAKSTARLERRKRLLAARWQVLDSVLEQAAKQVMADPSYPELLATLARRHAGPDASVHFSEADTRRVKGVKAGEPAAITGGLLVRMGKVEVVMSLEELLSEIRSDLAGELAKVLFEE